MKQVTIRGIPPEVEKAVVREAKKRDTSLNRALVWQDLLVPLRLAKEGDLD